MKKLEKDIFIKILALFLGVFFILYILSYALLRHFILEFMSDKGVDINLLMNEFNFVWLEISTIFFILFIVVFKVVDKIRKNVLHDTNELTKFMQDMSENKAYDSVLHIEHYIEFLHISTIMKNIVKRLNKKNKKTF